MTLPMPFLCFWVYLHGERMNQLFLRAWRKWSRVTDVVADTIPGMRVVKAFHQEEREKGALRRAQPRRDGGVQPHPRHVDLVLAGADAGGARHDRRGLGARGAAPAGRRRGGARRSRSGTFVAFLLYLTMFTPPIEIIGQIARIMNRATSSAHRIFEVLDTEPQVVDRTAAVRLEPVQGAVRFENVSFGYDGVRQVIRGVSFEVRPGEVIGLVGPSGGGKTTVTNLIARFYDPTAGRIGIDGVDLRDLDQGHYRRQIGMVLQDPYLFHGTVLENIRYGKHDATLDEVVVAARAANAHDFICQLPHGYETMVGERGHTLSGGERQRVSIARAILHDPRILVLDEATSSVDTETEYKIQEALDRLVAGRTVFAIAHRLSTLRRATRLFVIEDGKLTEQGTHAELLALAGGTYRRLYGMQRQLTAESGSLDEAALDQEVA